MKLDYAHTVLDDLSGYLLASRAVDEVAPLGDVRLSKENVARLVLLVRPATLKATTMPLPGYEVMVTPQTEEFERFTAWLYREYRKGDPLAGNQPTRPTWKPIVRYKGVTVHLLLCVPPKQWGIMMALHSTPEKLAKRLTSSRAHGGLMPDGWRVSDEGVILRDDGHAISAATEEEFFAAYGLPYVPVSRRR